MLGGGPSLSAQLPGAPGFSWFVAAFFQSMLASSHSVFPQTLCPDFPLIGTSLILD